MLAGAALAAMPYADVLTNPDAELIRLCEEHVVNINAYNEDPSDLDAEDNPLWHAYERTRDAIGEAKPQTFKGMLAKARAAKAEALNLDGSEKPEHTQAAYWAWDLVNDLVRLNGGAA